MDKIRKSTFFSGKDSDKNYEKLQTHHNIYCESQNVIDSSTINVEKEVKTKENRKKRFIANYNVFF